MGTFGESISALRKREEMSQDDLAQAIGHSQATVSRLEDLEKSPSDLKLLSKLARALSEPLADLLPQSFADEIFPANREDTFFAFCPNPFCSGNSTGRKENGNVYSSWKSNTQHSSEDYDTINYCGSCGTDLVKECSNCKRRISSGFPKFCVSCGNEISNRPTPEEWKKIEESHPKPTGSNGDDIPF